MARTAGLNITFSRCNNPAREQEWNDWYDTVHLPDIMRIGAFWTVTRWEVANRPPGGYPELGFTHINLLELEGPDVMARLQQAAAGNTERADRWRAEGRLNPNQGVIDTAAFRAVGKWTDKPEPSPRTRGLFLVFSTCTDPAKTDEWNAWYDEVHVPNMLATGAFFAATRWVRLEQVPFRPNYLAVYEVEHADVEAAVRRMAAAVPALYAAGQVHPNHCGSMRITMRPAGRWAGKGMHEVMHNFAQRG